VSRRQPDRGGDVRERDRLAVVLLDELEHGSEQRFVS
jgi:hypothetical protein